jgi:hypothetical protein
MSITAIARQAQGIRAGEVIAKLAEDPYFMRVDNRVTQPLPSGTATTKLQVAALTSATTVLEPSYRLILTTLVQTPADPLKVATALQLLAAIMRSSLTATLAAAAAMAEAPTMGPTGGPVAEAVAAVETTRTATPPEPHRVAMTPARRSRSYGTRRLLRRATTTASSPSLRDFVTSSSQRNSSPWESLSTTQSMIPSSATLRCYALSIENAGGNNDTKCLYFPFCLDQAPLTWLESLDKHSIDKWDQLK